ncbi:MAG: hypothetical protein RMM53_12385, partial [Bacteroidia bacterium]|nr:hypothetical protein [Bacteroidia bacterium]MDW8335004.1 hypothetical protein [Bacteroidia bacterium]
CPTRVFVHETGIRIEWGCRARNAVVYDLQGRTVWKGRRLIGATDVVLPRGMFVLSVDDATRFKIVRP